MLRILTTLGWLLLLAPVASAQTNIAFAIDSSDTVNPWNHLRFHNDPDNFQFAVVTDRTGGMRPGVFADAVHKLNLLQPEFVMCVGDLIEGYLEDTTILNQQWQEFDSVLSYLEMPFFYLPGNHDISNPVMRELWEQRLGKRYNHFVYKDVLFITMDTNDGEGVALSRDQIDYVKAAIHEYKDVRWTMIFMHHPIWSYAPGSGFEEIEAELAGREYSVFAGHTHRYLYEVRKGRNYYVLATTGGGTQLRGPKFSEFDQVSWLTMTDAGPRMLNLRLDGMLPHNIVDTTDYANARAMIEAAKFGHGIMTSSVNGIDWKNPEPFTAVLSLANTGTRTMHLQGRFFHHHGLHVEPAVITAEIPAGETRTFPLEITPVKSSYLLEPEPLEMAWELAYEQPQFQPEFALSGTYSVTMSSGMELINFTDIDVFLDQHEVSISSLLMDHEILYTVDGTTPTAASSRFETPIQLEGTTTIQARLMDADGNLSEVFSKEFRQVTPMPPIAPPSNRTPGLVWKYVEGDFTRLPDFSTLDFMSQGVAMDWDVEGIAQREDHFAIEYSGYVQAPEEGLYEVYTYSDDGSRLYIGDQLIVDNDGSHSARRRVGRVALKAGTYPIRIEYFDDFEGEMLRVAVRPVGQRDWTPITPAQMFH